MKIDSFKKELDKLNLIYNQYMLDQLETYYNFLIDYNSHTNLTAIKSKEEVYLKHFYDSLTVCRAVDLNNISKIIDIGSGAGFPGIVLKIFFPHLDITILDSNNKKTTFMKYLIEKLDLKNVNIVNNRAEEYAKNNLNMYDLCVSRAVAFIDIISELCLPFIKKEGKVVLMKGNFDNEKLILQKYQKALNISEYKIDTFLLQRVYSVVESDTTKEI